MPYSTKFWWGETLANRSFQGFLARKMLASLQQLALAPLVNGIWLGKILANDIHFAKVFRRQNIALYGMSLPIVIWLV